IVRMASAGPTTAVMSSGGFTTPAGSTFRAHEEIASHDGHLFTRPFRLTKANWHGDESGSRYQRADRPASSVAPEEGAKARALLDRVIAAKGGLAALRGIKSIKAVTSASMERPDGAMVPKRPRDACARVPAA